MNEKLQEVTIDNHHYENSHNQKDNTYLFIFDNNRFKFKRWTWGEKNRIINECITLNPGSELFEVNPVEFNEKILAQTLIEANIDGKEFNL
ncbi:MAG: hypothetical protein JSV56_01100, partial [Methanomassiliicoccales archaeon]